MVLVVGDDEGHVDHTDAPPDLHLQELRGQRVVAPPGLRDPRACLGKGGVVERHDYRRLWGEGLEATGEHGAEQVARVPPRSVEGLVVG